MKESQHASAPGILKALAKFDDDLARYAGGADLALRSKAWNDKECPVHHGIIPTAVPDYSRLTEDERRVFKLIARNYIAQFYPSFTYKQTTVVTSCGGSRFKSSGRVPVRMGWRDLFTKDKVEDDSQAIKEDARELPKMAMGDEVVCKDVKAPQKLTKAPPRYSEARLLDSMTNISDHVTDPVAKKKLAECRGIGTPATQAKIIERLKEVGYVFKKGSFLHSTPGAREFVLGLPEELTSAVLTAQWELAQAKIEQGKLPLDTYMNGIGSWVSDLTRRTLGTRISITLKKAAPVEGLKAAGAGSTCPKCQIGTMVPRIAKKGPNEGKYFLSCNAYPSCTHIENVIGQTDAKPRKSSSGSKKSPRKSPAGRERDDGTSE